MIVWLKEVKKKKVYSALCFMLQLRRDEWTVHGKQSQSSAFYFEYGSKKAHSPGPRLGGEKAAPGRGNLNGWKNDVQGRGRSAVHPGN